ncbi:MAG: hypothetical protein AAF921_28900, partial [Cyanobacteria bacterium P01_D01_bin.44]
RIKRLTNAEIDRRLAHSTILHLPPLLPLPANSKSSVHALHATLLPTTHYPLPTTLTLCQTGSNILFT